MEGRASEAGDWKERRALGHHGMEGLIGRPQRLCRTAIYMAYKDEVSRTNIRSGPAFYTHR